MNVVERRRQTGTEAARSHAPRAEGPLGDLAGEWVSVPGGGWNIVAVPHWEGAWNYRLVVSQVRERLTIDLPGAPVTNRGIRFDGGPGGDDQIVISSTYAQEVEPVATAESPGGARAVRHGSRLHSETGRLMWMPGAAAEAAMIRLGNIPNGASFLAPGRVRSHAGPPEILPVPVLPEGIGTEPVSDEDGTMLAPYRRFATTPFLGRFDPLAPVEALRTAAAWQPVAQTTRLTFDTEFDGGGILSSPFLKRQANPVSVRCDYWLEELEPDGSGRPPALQLQYAQVVMLEFFPRTDGQPGLIRWPHVSVNTLRRDHA